ncbi:MAG: hypothetical protein FJ187_05755 [Gammaproteobacteria bacterium]|nr:hypothetical protein [Gammaproteobacteria bacterium]
MFRNYPAIFGCSLATLVTFAAATAATAETAANGAAPPSATLATSHGEFCVVVQRLLVDTTLPMQTTLQATKDDFTESKASVTPLGIQQFVEPDASGQAREISCKTKTADHLRAEHGAGAARDPALAPRSCRDIQRRVVLDVWSTLKENERTAAVHAPQRVMLDADSKSYTGSGWIGSPAEAYLAADGRLHLRASALYADWEDWRWKIMPKSFRGNHYCHLVAPERVRALMTGGERLSPQPK